MADVNTVDSKVGTPPQNPNPAGQNPNVNTTGNLTGARSGKSSMGVSDKRNGVDIWGREVKDGKVYVDGNWVDGVVFDKYDYTITESTSSKENARVALDGHKEVPEAYRRALLLALENVGVGGSVAELSYNETDTEVNLNIKVTLRDPGEVEILDPLTPLGQATLPREKSEEQRREEGPKTAEERDAKAIKEGTVPASTLKAQATAGNRGIETGKIA